MFKREWQRQRADLIPGRLAIVDDNPKRQFLFPEFQLAQRLLLGRGVDTLALDPSGLEYANGELTAGGQHVDMAYNRLVSRNDATELWRDRHGLFFKPVAGHGSKGVYRGDKMTRRVFESIPQGDYIAHNLVPPGERNLRIEPGYRLNQQLLTCIIIPAARS